MSQGKSIVILGVFMADTTYRAARLPKRGETLLGSGFALGPGGKGSNQAVAAALLGGDVTLLSRLGNDAFADLAYQTWRAAGVTPEIIITPESPTGAACIFVDDTTGENAIIITPGAASLLSVADVASFAGHIQKAGVFVTQLEQPVAVARRALGDARLAGALTILNPAPACPLDDEMLATCDYITPNEGEAEAMTGIKVTTLDDARRAAQMLRQRGASNAVITLGAMGALLATPEICELVPAINAGSVVETTGAGDAFNGAFAYGLAQGMTALEATQFGCAAAGISVTRHGAASSMPTLAEVKRLL